MAVEQHLDTVLTTGRKTAASFERVLLAFEVIGVYARVRWLVLRHGAIPTVSVLRRGLMDTRPDSAQVVRAMRFGRAVVKVLRLLPTDSRCLMRSLVLTRMLARRGVYAIVVLGVRPEPRFGAHAWVEVNDQPVLPADELIYQRLTQI